MKKNLKKYLLFLCCGFIAAVFSLSARADDQEYACNVLLCLSNPGSPTQYAECEPPIERMLEELARGKGVPTCILKGSPGTYLERVRRYFEDCPDGSTPYEMGNDPYVGYVASGHYENDRFGRKKLVYNQPIELRQNERRACVNGYLDTVPVQIERDGAIESIPVYSDVLIQRRVAKPYFIDIYVDNVKVRSVNF